MSSKHIENTPYVYVPFAVILIHDAHRNLMMKYLNYVDATLYV